MLGLSVRPLDEGSPRGAIVVEPRGSPDVLRVADGDVIALIEAHGAVLLRGFDLRPEQLSRFTDRFTHEYRRDTVRSAGAYRRPVRFGQDQVTNVTLGRSSIKLHSEAAHGVVWPELLWFYCDVPSTTGGYTTICDGLSFWDGLASSIQQRFLAHALRYDLRIPIATRSERGGSMPWRSQTPGVSGEIDLTNGVARFSVRRFAVQETRLAAERPSLAFANYLLHSRSDPEVERVVWSDGSSIDDALFAELDGVAERLTRDVHWDRGDLMLLDNRRFMHGRRSFGEDDPRDILQIQSIRASFPYGVTTRRSISASR